MEQNLLVYLHFNSDGGGSGAWRLSLVSSLNHQHDATCLLKVQCRVEDQVSATRIEGEDGTGDVPALCQVVRHVAVGCVRLVVVWGLLELRHTLVEMMLHRSVCINSSPRMRVFLVCVYF